jgi:hypothetical protein
MMSLIKDNFTQSLDVLRKEKGGKDEQKGGRERWREREKRKRE